MMRRRVRRPAPKAANRAASAAVVGAVVAVATVWKANQAGEHSETSKPAALAPDTARFGSVPDEIDTTPSDTRSPSLGAPAAPVWSLKDDVPDTTPSDTPRAQNDEGKPVKRVGGSGPSAANRGSATLR